MTLQELLEQAHLDALGMLDPAEQAEFEKAFAAASPAVKAQLRAEQARWAASESLLPDVEPPPHLRERVMEAVTAAMAEAEIGQEREELELRPSRRVARFWRASTIGLLAACVVLGVAFFQVDQQARNLAAITNGGLTSEALLTAARTLPGGGTRFRYEALYAAETRRVFFAPVDNSAAAKAFKGSVVVIATPSDGPHLVCEGINTKPGTDYRLVVLDANDKVADELTSFAKAELPMALGFKLDLVKGTRLALVEAAADTGAMQILLVGTV